MPTDLSTLASWLWETADGLRGQLRPAKAELRSLKSELGMSGSFDTRHSSFDISPRLAVHDLEGDPTGRDDGSTFNRYYDDLHSQVSADYPSTN